MQRHNRRELTPAAAAAAEETDESDLLPHSSPLLPNLPDELALQCIARVPRFYHSELSLVSKSWRSMLRSPFFFSTRKRLNCTQSILYLTIGISPEKLLNGSHFPWLALDLDLSNPKNPSNLSLVPPIPYETNHPAIAVLGPRIYVLGGLVDGFPSTTVCILDCRFNKWEIGPKMSVGRAYAAAGVLNGKIYVMGGCFDCFGDPIPNNWAEVFDPALGCWITVPSPVEVRMQGGCAIAVLEEKFYVENTNRKQMVIFDPCDSSWRKVQIRFGECFLRRRFSRLKRYGLFQAQEKICSFILGSHYVVDGILYRPIRKDGEIMGLDLKVGKWQALNWVQPFHEFHGKTMKNVGGKLCVLWVERRTYDEYGISCGEVEFCKDNNGELWGSIVWSQLLKLVPFSPSLKNCCTVEFNGDGFLKLSAACGISKPHKSFNSDWE